MTEKIRPIPSSAPSLDPRTSLEQQKKQDHPDSKKQQLKQEDSSKKGPKNSLFDEFV